MSVKIKWEERTKDGKNYALLRWTEQGIRKSRVLGYVTPSEAEAERKREEARITLNLSLTATAPALGLRLGDLIEAYLEESERKQRGGEGHRINLINRCSHLGKHLGDVLVNRLSEDDLDDYVRLRRKEMGGRRSNRLPKKTTVRCELNQLRQIINRAHRRGQVARACPELPRFKDWPDDARPARRLTEKDVSILVQLAEETGRPELARLITFMAWCPRRPIAIFALTRHDCRLILEEGLKRSERQIWIARDKGQRELGWTPITEPAYQVLKAQLQARIGPPDDPVWHKAYGGAYTVQTLRNQLDRLSKRAGVTPVARPYDLRKFGAVRVIKFVGSTYKALPFTGHQSSITLEKHYLYQERGEAEDMAAAITWGKK